MLYIYIYIFFLNVCFFLLCQAYYFSYCFVWSIDDCYTLNNLHVLLLHYEEAEKQTFGSLRMTQDGTKQAVHLARIFQRFQVCLSIGSSEENIV